MSGAVSTANDKSSDVGNIEESVEGEDGTAMDSAKGELTDEEKKAAAESDAAGK